MHICGKQVFSIINYYIVITTFDGHIENYFPVSSYTQVILHKVASDTHLLQSCPNQIHTTVLTMQTYVKTWMTQNKLK